MRLHRYRVVAPFGVALLVVTIAGIGMLAQPAPPRPHLPGVEGKGVTLLPNGWRIAPAGRHLQIGDLPLALTLSRDGRYAIVTNNGWLKPTLTVVDLHNHYVRERAPVDHAWLGLAWDPTGRRLFSSGASQNTINEFTFQNGHLTPAGSYPLGRAERYPGFGRVENAGFVGGLAASADGKRLYAVQVLGKAVALVDLERARVLRIVDLDAEPYTCLLSGDGRTLFISLWGGAKVLFFDAETLEAKGAIGVGEHPNAIVLSKDGSRLFVACANTNAVWVIDLATRKAIEQISVALYPNAPAGTTPNSLALSPDGRVLAVANADNNTVALVDIENPARAAVQGFIPTGWYPTTVLFTPSGMDLLIASGKGLTSSANPRGPSPGDRGAEGQYTGSMLQGALSIVPMPDKSTLEAYTKRVYEVTAYTDAKRLTPANAPAASPIPRKVGDSSPIKYVFYVIRENRTYDQVFGDFERGNGDPTLTLFGEEVTPNAHALAREFVLLDNFYVDAEVSYDGHAFSTAAYATDVVEKIWPTNYGGRGFLYLSEGGWENRNPFGNIAAPSDGYLWDFANRAGVTVRSYGEFATWSRRGEPVRAAVPGLEGKISPTYAPYDLSIPDNQRVDAWLEEFKGFEAGGNLPRLNIIRLGNDHTSGTIPGTPTPRAMVAENDLALGRVVETISKSPFWKESAIFVIEDDSQNGPDHVDAHRSPALVVGPFVRRQATDSTLYTTSSVLRTMELILGLPPMSQYDAAAAPMYGAFQNTPVVTPFTHLPNRYPIDERNTPESPGAQASLRMNFSEADLTPELELNQIVWWSVHGPDSAMPPPVRSAFVRSQGDEDDAEEPDGRGGWLAWVESWWRD